MIYIVNLNPSIDYHMYLDFFERDQTNRSQNEAIHIGGKGINVATVLNNYAVDSVLTGFLAGFTGDYIEESLKKKPFIEQGFIRVEGLTRINLKLQERESESEINARGPQVNEADILRIEKLLEQVKKGDILVLSGSMLDGIERDWYLQIIEKASKKGVRVFFDYASSLLKSSLKKGVYLIKPNKDEFETMMRKTYEDDAMMIKDASDLMQAHPESRMILSLGSEGAYYFYRKEIFYIPARDAEPIHTVGAGDSMVAGYIYAYIQNKSRKECFKHAVASANASIFSEDLARKEDLYRYLDEIKIEEVLE